MQYTIHALYTGWCTGAYSPLFGYTAEVAVCMCYVHPEEAAHNQFLNRLRIRLKCNQVL